MAALLSYALPIALWTQYALMLLCAGILLLHPLVLHANKQYLKAQSSRLIKRSRWVTLLLGCAGLAALLLGWGAFAKAWMLGLMVCAISRLGGKSKVIRFPRVYLFICTPVDQSGTSAQTRLKYNSSNVSMASRGTSHHC